MSAISAAAQWQQGGLSAVMGQYDHGWAKEVNDPSSLLRADASLAVRSANGWLWNSYVQAQSAGQDALRSGHTGLDLMRIGVAASERGEGAMRFWTQGMLGVQGGHPTEYVVDINKEAAAPFSEGLKKRWGLLNDGLMKQLPGEIRQRYQGVLNDEAGRALQLTMRYDALVDEYAPVDLPGVAVGGGAAPTIHGAMSEDALKQFGDAIARDKGASLPGFRLDTGVIDGYFQAKGQAAMRYAQDYDESLRPGIVAGLMGKRFAAQWMAGELGYVQGQGFTPLDGAEHPHSDGVVQRWNGLVANKLDRMPGMVRGRYDKVANSMLAQSLQQAMIQDKQIGKYGEARAHLWSADGGDRPNFKFWLNGDNSLGYEQIVHHDCISEIVLPIVGAVLTVIPVTAPIGIALNTALAVKNGIETGNWLGAAVGVVGGAVGLGGLGAFGSGAIQAGFQAAGTAMKVGMGAFSLANSIDNGDILGALGSATSLASAGAGMMGYGANSGVAVGLNAVGSGVRLAQGITQDNPFSIASGGLGLLGAGVSYTRLSAQNDLDSIQSTAKTFGLKPDWMTIGRIADDQATLATTGMVSKALNFLDGANSLAATGFGAAQGHGAPLSGFGLSDTLLHMGLNGYQAKDFEPGGKAHDLSKGNAVGALAANPMTRYLNAELFGRAH